MTPSELITLINTEIATNGNQDITAEVLRPVLIAMVNQINGLVGDASGLPSGSDTVIEAINNVTGGGLTIHEGTANPNDTPPESYAQGDFYSQKESGNVIAFWQYTGLLWAEIISRREQKLRKVATTAANYAVDVDDDLVVYTGSNVSDLITLQNANASLGKIIILVNSTATSISTSTYKNLSNANATALAANSVLVLQSNGVNWLRINNA